MKSSTLVILLVVAVLAILAALLLQNSGRESPSSVASLQGDDPHFTVADAAKVEIVDADNRVTIKKQEDSWQVTERDGFAADTARLAQMLIELSGLSAAQVVDVPEDQLGRLLLNDPTDSTASETGTKIIINNAEGEPLSEWLAGGDYFPDSHAPGSRGGRYYRQPGQPIILSLDPLRDLSANPADWLRKDLILPNLQVASVELSFTDEDKQGWQILSVESEQEADDQAEDSEGSEGTDTAAETVQPELVFQGLQDDEQVRAGAIDELVRRLEGLRFEDIRNKGDGFKAIAQVNITTIDGINYLLEVAEAEGGMVPVTVTKQDESAEGPDAEAVASSESSIVYLVNNWALGQLVEPRSEWVEKVAEQPAEEAVSE